MGSFTSQHQHKRRVLSKTVNVQQRLCSSTYHYRLTDVSNVQGLILNNPVRKELRLPVVPKLDIYKGPTLGSIILDDVPHFLGR